MSDTKEYLFTNLINFFTVKVAIYSAAFTEIFEQI